MKKKKILSKALLLAGMAGAVTTLAACASSANAEKTETTTAAAAQAETKAAGTDTTTATNAIGNDVGFEEITIFEDEEISFINVNAVYFQPVPMAPGQENYEDFDLHLECDVAAMDNNLGYGKGDWIPYLTIDYKVIGEGEKVAAEGTFMNMAASDGPHYGANIKLPDAGKYSLEFTIHSPAENGYLVHSDSETGPGGLLEDPEYWGNGNLVLRVDDCWDYVPQEW